QQPHSQQANRERRSEVGREHSGNCLTFFSRNARDQLVAGVLFVMPELKRSAFTAARQLFSRAPNSACG
ncbi:MAG: hypothetical protein ABWY21_00680, partial [Rhodococcus sp. (in: high G+C Gram-positive bacteria)]